MTIKRREVFHGRYFRHGGSYAVLIPPDVRDALKLVPGDEMTMCVDQEILWMRRATREMIIDRTKMAAIFDKLFPDKVPANG